MNFSLVIPNLNGEKYLAESIPSFLQSLHDKFEIILIDNNSQDNSINLAKKIFPKIIVIKNNSNLGFAKAVNQGILKAKYDYVALLNNDLTLDKNWFDNITKDIEKNPKAVAFSGTVLDKVGDSYESVGLRYFNYGKCQNILNKKKFNPQKHSLFKNTNIWGASAAAIIYHRPTLIKVGLFDETFFAYEEDVDLALRLHNLNYVTRFVPKSISYHLGGGTSRRMGNFRHIMDAKNWIYIIIKNYPLSLIFKNFFPIIIERMRNFSGLIKNTSMTQIPISIYRAYFPIVSNFPQMITKRHQIAKLLHDYRH